MFHQNLNFFVKEEKHNPFIFNFYPINRNAILNYFSEKQWCWHTDNIPYWGSQIYIIVLRGLETKK